jgi:hypothetical protein
LRPQFDFVGGANQRVATSIYLRWRFAAVLVSLVALCAGPAAAQQDAGVPSTGPLPTIIYPSRIAKPARSEFASPPAAAPAPDCVLEDDCPTRYVLVGGYWGFWDLNRHFHPLSGRHIHAMRPTAVTYRAVAVTHSDGIGRGRAHR